MVWLILTKLTRGALECSEMNNWIFRYLNGTTGYGILFARQHRDNSVVGYVDSDYAGNMDVRRSTTRYVFKLSGGPICWRSTLQL